MKRKSTAVSIALVLAVQLAAAPVFAAARQTHGPRETTKQKIVKIVKRVLDELSPPKPDDPPPPPPCTSNCGG